MNVLRHLILVLLCAAASVLRADPASVVSTPATAAQVAVAGAGTAAVMAQAEAPAAVATQAVAEVRHQDLLEHLVDVVLGWFGVASGGNTITHYIVAGLFLIGSFLLRHVVTTIFFAVLKRWASKTETTLDDKLFHALESPVATLISVAGAMAALRVLKLSEMGDRVVGYLSTFAFSVVVFWILLRAFNAILDHAHEVAVQRQMGVAPLMPWLKKALLVVFFAVGLLMVAKNLGLDVGAALTTLGIGGLAFALAAQDTIANVFGSVVVATDQPFKVGETVQIGSNTGVVEDIGLRSTRIRTLAKSLLVIPNKTVAGETITNLSRFTGRRIETIVGLTYSTTADQMQQLVEDIRRLLQAEAEIDPTSVAVYFRDFNASSLDIWVLYNAKDGDFHLHMALRQRINLALMRLVEARGLSMAYPTQTLLFDGEIAKQMAARRASA